MNGEKLVKNIILRKLIERQVVPTKEDIASVKNLAERLRGLTDAETLNNTLEWQERNIVYWRERGYLDILLTLFQPLVLIGLLIIFFWVSTPLIIVLYLVFMLYGLPSLVSLLLSSISTLSLVFLMVTKANIVTRLCYIVIFSYPAYNVIREFLLKHPSAENVIALMNLSIINRTIFGISLFNYIFSLSIDHLHIKR